MRHRCEIGMTTMKKSWGLRASQPRARKVAETFEKGPRTCSFAIVHETREAAPRTFLGYSVLARAKYRGEREGEGRGRGE